MVKDSYMEELGLQPMRFSGLGGKSLVDIFYFLTI